MVPYSALTDYDRSVVLTLDDRPDPQLWGHCRFTHNSSMICFFLCLQWFLFGILAMDGMSERNHCHIIIFSLHCFKGFSVASWRIMQHVIEKPLPYNKPVVTYGVLTVRDRFVMFFNITDLITNCGGTVSL